ncbi:MAG: alpha/beta hydrolase [Rhodobacter sp.]|nr:alpha/beta hydrolase [Rhodobacter sp.]
MPVALRGGTETFWRSWGEGAAEVLLLHCSLAHSGAWEGFARALGRPAVAFDAPGHGQSGPVDPGVDYQVQNLRVAEDFLGNAPIDVVGHSFGATVALRLAAERPEAVRRLVLIEPVLFVAARGLPAFDDHVASIRPFVAAMEAGDTVRAARYFTAMWGTGVTWEEMRAEKQQSLAEQIHIIAAQDAALFQDSAGMVAPGRLEAIGTPTLLLAGGLSPPIVHAVQDELEARMPETERVVVPGAGHMVPITHAKAVAEVVSGFLSAG